MFTSIILLLITSLRRFFVSLYTYLTVNPLNNVNFLENYFVKILQRSEITCCGNMNFCFSHMNWISRISIIVSDSYQLLVTNKFIVPSFFRLYPISRLWIHKAVILNSLEIISHLSLLLCHYYYQHCFPQFENFTSHYTKSHSIRMGTHTRIKEVCVITGIVWESREIANLLLQHWRVFNRYFFLETIMSFVIYGHVVGTILW